MMFKRLGKVIGVAVLLALAACGGGGDQPQQKGPPGPTPVGVVTLREEPVTLTVEIAERPPATVESTAYFVVNEALTNVARHASATRAHVAVVRAGDRLVVEVRDDGKGGAIARFAEVTDRTAAEALRGTALTVPRAALPPLGQGEYYHADLIGLAAVSDSGEAIVEVIPGCNEASPHAPKTELWLISPNGKQRRLRALP